MVPSRFLAWLNTVLLATMMVVGLSMVTPSSAQACAVAQIAELTEDAPGDGAVAPVAALPASEFSLDESSDAGLAPGRAPMTVEFGINNTAVFTPFAYGRSGDLQPRKTGPPHA